MAAEATTAAAAVTDVNVEPAEAGLDEPFTLKASYTLPDALKAARWQVHFIVDMAHTKHSVPLGTTEPQDLAAGASALSFQAPGIEVGNLTPHEVLNYGLLQAVLQSADGKEVLSLGVITQVSKGDGKMMRRFITPS